MAYMQTLSTGKILDSLGSLHESLTPSAKKISSYVLSNPTEVTKVSIAELSSIVNAGEATIIRFCRSLGFKGFQDFKMELAIELSKVNQDERSILDTEVTDKDNAEEIGSKLYNAITAVLGETLNLININILEATANKIKQSKGVYFFGVGSSGITAEDAKNKLMRIGYNVDALTNNHFMYMKASLLQPGDIAIGISHSGTSAETIKALKLAKENGAATAVITHNPRSPIASHADFILVNGNRQGKLQGDSIGTKISQLFVLDLIYTLLVQKDPDLTQQNKVKTTTALD
ncbi:MurR/RpiR family transcriptional regulator [Vibrio rumoiensis]|uniref:MurR/RpiR family transcriptional regulator n=1 Tax=Vibrio rumoiensis TaxID=76258 RepID=A0ABW7IZI1_9VIBR|nr:MurR/RpiR family transcriptional regulator [Vibrio rumoiensis]